MPYLVSWNLHFKKGKCIFCVYLPLHKIFLNEYSRIQQQWLLVEREREMKAGNQGHEGTTFHRIFCTF